MRSDEFWMADACGLDVSGMRDFEEGTHEFWKRSARKLDAVCITDFGGAEELGVRFCAEIWGAVVQCLVEERTAAGSR
jgi:hypothetical protein